MSLEPHVAIIVLMLAPSLGAAFVGIGVGIGFAIGHRIFTESGDPPPGGDVTPLYRRPDPHASGGEESCFTKGQRAAEDKDRITVPGEKTMKETAAQIPVEENLCPRCGHLADPAPVESEGEGREEEAWLDAGSPIGALKRCPECESLELEGATVCSECGGGPFDDRAWRESRRTSTSGQGGRLARVVAAFRTEDGDEHVYLSDGRSYWTNDRVGEWKELDDPVPGTPAALDDGGERDG